MSAILGVDLGERRIGVAIADGPGAGARPLTTLHRGRDIAADAAAVRQLIEEHDVDELVSACRSMPPATRAHKPSRRGRGSMPWIRRSAVWW